MRTASPWWASLVFGVGLLFVLLGERIFGYSPGIRLVLTGIGIAAIVGITGLRAYTTLATSGARRNVERTLLLCQLGVVLALALYALSTTWGTAHFHMTDTGSAKFSTVLTVIYGALLVASLTPLFMIEASLGTALRVAIDLGSASDEGIEYFRVRDVGWSGLSVGLALSFLMVTCNVADERNLEKDVSYFKTSSPGDSTKAIMGAQTEPIKVLLFFPPTNEVEHQVRDYFSALESASGHLAIETHDRLGDAELAGKYKVSKDGMILLVKGTGEAEKTQTIDVDTDIDKARKGSKLRNFDREVNSALLKLVRDKRKAYLVSGHGEVTDPDSVPPEMKGKVPERKTTLLKKELAQLNYESKDLGLVQLAHDVPEDATIVIMVAPSVPLQAAEWDALGRYLDKGGRLMIALDPKGDPSLGSLEQKLGVKYNPAPLTDDQAFLPQHHGPVDRRFVITNQFSAHASTTALSRASANQGLVLIESGALEDAPATPPAPKKTVTIRSMETSWLDFNDNYVFDAGSEKRSRYTIGEAFEGPKLKDKDGKDKDGWRALVFADGDLFDDISLPTQNGRQVTLIVSGPLLDDAVKWLGGEEVFAGDVVTEDDKPIQHTKGQDAVWFTLTIVGMPLIVFALGMVGTLTRKRRKTAEVKP